MTERQGGDRDAEPKMGRKAEKKTKREIGRGRERERQ